MRKLLWLMATFIATSLTTAAMAQEIEWQKVDGKRVAWGDHRCKDGRQDQDQHDDQAGHGQAIAHEAE